MADRQMVSVDAQALRTVLEALNGPGHLIREIQMTRSVAALTGDDPIGTLIEDFNNAVNPARNAGVEVRCHQEESPEDADGSRKDK